MISDPSYAGQIITLTYPQIGNYGVNLDDVQSDTPALRGLVVHDMCTTPSNWRSQLSLPDFLRQHQVVAIEGVDTRALTRHIRDCGAQRAVLSTLDTNAESLLAKVRASESIVGLNLVPSVSCAAPHPFVAPGASGAPGAQAPSHSFALAPAAAPRYKVIAYDCGVKRSILENLVRVGCSVEVVPWDTPAATVLAARPDGVFL
ncbi:MAG: carbamoyl-phosphate synthase domain-containing protein, partial [Raoultibacter sp.]